MEEHDLVIGGCGRILTGFCLLAGRQDLAKRIRIRFPSRVAAPSEDTSAEDGAGEGPSNEPAPASSETAGSQPATT